MERGPRARSRAALVRRTARAPSAPPSAAAAAAAATLGGGEGSEGTSGESLEGHDAAAELGAMRRAETTKKKQNEGVSYVDGSRAYVSPDGERLRANTVVEAFGGLKAFLRLKALGEQKARL